MKRTIIAVLVAGGLAACGGGGGGGSSGGSASTSTGSGSSTSTSAPAVALIAAPGASAGSFTATGDVVNDTLAFINAMRAQAGLPALSFQSGVAQAATNHSLWEQDNNVVGHYETSGQPGYTGVSPTDRVNQFYKTQSVGEVTTGFTGAFASSTEPIQALFDAPFHRAIILFDSVYAGPGDATTTDTSKLSTLTVDFADYKQVIADNQLVAWPYNGMTGVDTGWYANESPNPVASYNNGALENTVVGYPVTLSGGDNAAFSNVSFTIADAAGNNVPCVETDSSNNSDATRLAMCVPTAKLATNTTYTVKVSGSLANNSFAATPFAVSWTFTTATTDNAPIGAPTSASAQSASGSRAFEQVSPRRIILN
ncbi:CAP domain-containing protein [Trinickia dinghuensis]|uniref:CAP domain-containing protein n=1 Tax=Trinickia dinghuensis TaxID=2291023 RepID=A0A3D8K598_9BURK|nr:CAP domain-containing protein [Trinickia dinghuensis]RDU99741.1 CAP domain-containing protein [Trinickia dinghuensis]